MPYFKANILITPSKVCSFTNFLGIFRLPKSDFNANFVRCTYIWERDQHYHLEIFRLFSTVAPIFLKTIWTRHLWIKHEYLALSQKRKRRYYNSWVQVQLDFFVLWIRSCSSRFASAKPVLVLQNNPFKVHTWLLIIDPDLALGQKLAKIQEFNQEIKKIMEFYFLFSNAVKKLRTLENMTIKTI